MQDTDALVEFTLAATTTSPADFIPGAAEAHGQLIEAAAAAASEAEGTLLAVPLANQINPNIRVPKEFLLELNSYEIEGQMHNEALDLIVKERIAGVDLYDKLINKDRETIDKFLKLRPNLQDDNIRKQAVDALIAEAEEFSIEVKDKIAKIINAENYSDAISYLNASTEETVILTEVYSTCNNYFINNADFGQVAGYINGKITYLLNKGKDMTVQDQRLACTFTVLKHSYYYWHSTK